MASDAVTRNAADQKKRCRQLDREQAIHLWADACDDLVAALQGAPAVRRVQGRAVSDSSVILKIQTRRKEGRSSPVSRPKLLKLVFKFRFHFDCALSLVSYADVRGANHQLHVASLLSGHRPPHVHHHPCDFNIICGNVKVRGEKEVSDPISAPSSARTSSTGFGGFAAKQYLLVRCHGIQLGCTVSVSTHLADKQVTSSPARVHKVVLQDYSNGAWHRAHRQALDALLQPYLLVIAVHLRKPPGSD